MVEAYADPLLGTRRDCKERARWMVQSEFLRGWRSYPGSLVGLLELSSSR